MEILRRAEIFHRFAGRLLRLGPGHAVVLPFSLRIDKFFHQPGHGVTFGLAPEQEIFLSPRESHVEGVDAVDALLQMFVAIVGREG